jgi:5-methyltetrahydrofolate--homocysteine methyltransferase
MTYLTRGQLGIEREQGKRYSWGYPACPDLDDHAIVWKLMPQIEKDLGLTLTESFQIVPEQSTVAIFAHHPSAKYYSVGNLDRSAQILGD